MREIVNNVVNHFQQYPRVPANFFGGVRWLRLSSPKKFHLAKRSELPITIFERRAQLMGQSPQ
jgi:hypothetical protein